MTAATNSRPWGRLFRLPNLCTVPGDPLAGCMLAWAAGFEPASLPLVAAAAAASLCIYAAGLVMNDIADLDEDRNTRSNRPLPTGEIDIGQAWVAALMLGGAGIGLAAATGPIGLVVSLILLATVVAYNWRLKRSAVPGAVSMGLCRGLSLLLGAATTGVEGLLSPFVVIATVTLVIYVASVTLIADRETEQVTIGMRRWIPALALVIGFGVIYLKTPGMLGTLIDEPTSFILTRLLALGALAWAVQCARQLSGAPAPDSVGATVGKLIRGLILFQAACASVLPWLGGFCALIILAGWPLNRRLSETYYAS